MNGITGDTTVNELADLTDYFTVYNSTDGGSYSLELMWNDATGNEYYAHSWVYDGFHMIPTTTIVQDLDADMIKSIVDSNKWEDRDSKVEAYVRTKKLNPNKFISVE